MKLSKISFRTFIHNVYSLFAYDFHQSDLSQQRQLETQQGQIMYLRLFMLYQQMSHFFNDENSTPYREELDYVMKNGVCHFPYEKQRTIDKIDTGYDGSKKMPYVFHQGKRLYFPSDYTEEKAAQWYRELIEMENLLGGGYTVKAPHQYQTDAFKVEEGDVFVDVGAAEGLVSLDVVDKASKVYLVESDKKWIPALNATFEPYKDKYLIINKLVSNADSKVSVTLGGLLQKEKHNPLFIKMDIEGYELMVLNASKDFLSEVDSVKMACCTYHKHGDAQEMASFFEQLGYRYEFSDGWMLQWLNEDGPVQPPFFRHGVLRARK